MCKPTHCWAVEVRGQDNLFEVGLIEDGLKEVLRVAGAGVPVEELWIRGKAIPPAVAHITPSQWDHTGRC